MKTNLDRSFKMDSGKEEEGVWVDLGDGVRIRIRRFKSRKSQDVRKELDKPHADQIRRGSIASEVAEDLLVKQMAFGVISGWEGITQIGDDGVTKPLPYTGEAAYQLLKSLPELRDELFSVSVDRDAFRQKMDEEAEKNLPPTYSGA